MKNCVKVFFIILLVFVSGCIPRGKVKEEDPLHGTKGLTIKFIRGMPPYRVYEGDQINIGVELENDGSYPIDEGYFNLITEKQYINPEPYEKLFTSNKPLYGRTIISQEGEKKLISIFANVGSVQSFSGIDTNIIAEACYGYKTNLSTEVCIDTNQYDNSYDKPCNVKTLTFGGQGAPVSIKKVEPRFTTKINDLGKEIVIPQFILYIKKTQDGEIINKDRLSDICGIGEVSPDDYGKVIINAKLGKEKLKCTPGSLGNPLIMSQDMGKEFEGNVVRCVYDKGIDKSRGVYTSILNVELDYGFKVTTKTKVTVLNSRG